MARASMVAMISLLKEARCLAEAVELCDFEEIRSAWEGVKASPGAIESLLAKRIFWRAAGIGAAQEGDEETLGKLIALGWNVSERDADGACALHWAAGAGQAGCLRALLSAGADPLSKDNGGSSAGHWAARGWHGQGDEGDAGECLRMLIEAGWSPNDRDGQLETAGHWAAAWGEDESLGILREAGWEVDSEDQWGWMAGHRAAERGQEETLMRLIEMGWDPSKPSVTDPRNQPASKLAREHGHEECAELLEAAALARRESKLIGRSSRKGSQATAPKRGL